MDSGAAPRVVVGPLSSASEFAKFDRETAQAVARLRLASDCEPSVSSHEIISLDADDTTFGRYPSCDVVLDSVRIPKMISRLHGRLRRHCEVGKIPEWSIIDNNSLNGILVNGSRVDGDGRVLQSGDVVTFGRLVVPPEFKFIFEITRPAELSAEEDLLEEQTERMRRIAHLRIEPDEVVEHRHPAPRCQQRRRSSVQLDVADLHSELICSICQDWLVHSANIECSHTFCWSCVDTWLLHKKFECPLCRQAVTRPPLRSRALDTIVQKTVGQLTASERSEYAQRASAAEKTLERGKRLHMELETSVNDALKKGKAFFHIDSNWSWRERDVFARGVKDYSGETRETYCKLTGLTVQWVHSADVAKLCQALHNLQLPDLVLSAEEDIRQRLLMFLRYG